MGTLYQVRCQSCGVTGAFVDGGGMYTGDRTSNMFGCDSCKTLDSVGGSGPAHCPTCQMIMRRIPPSESGRYLRQNPRNCVFCARWISGETGEQPCCEMDGSEAKLPFGDQTCPCCGGLLQWGAAAGLSTMRFD